MRQTPHPSRIIAFEISARRDVRFWGLLLIGLAFAYAGFTVDPASNCSEGGECAPWLVPIAAIFGVLAAAAGLGQILHNASRGSRLDLDANRLDWWQNRTALIEGDCGSIALDRIDRILIKRDSEDEDISLYGLDGERLAFFDRDVIGGSLDDWAAQLQLAVPSIKLEIRK